MNKEKLISSSIVEMEEDVALSSGGQVTAVAAIVAIILIIQN